MFGVQYNDAKHEKSLVWFYRELSRPVTVVVRHEFGSERQMGRFPSGAICTVAKALKNWR